LWAQSSDKLNWSITPYIWASNTKVDLTLDDAGIGEGEISFKDLLDVLDTAGMIHIEAGKGSWSMFGDLTYLQTSDTTERELLSVDTKSKQTFIDTAVAYWPGGVGSQLNFFAGLRYSGFSDRYRFKLGEVQLPEQRSSSNYYDALLGVRYRFDLTERWSLITRGDGSFGDSKGTWLVQANFAYTVGKRRQNRILFGYQYKQAEFKDGDLVSKFTYHGPMAGFNFRF
ncbi:MAG: hypothetical protein OEU35_12150, partial [Desulfuromonadales bacterium]|nr:hypothetical protein [Desulfuromonadales bacterium]